jgi:hypothetical protein
VSAGLELDKDIWIKVALPLDVEKSNKSSLTYCYRDHVFVSCTVCRFLENVHAAAHVHIVDVSNLGIECS